MGIILNPNRNLTEKLLEMRRANDGYCPCSLARVSDLKCMCKEFREMESGICHCGLYIKTKQGMEILQ